MGTSEGVQSTKPDNRRMRKACDECRSRKVSCSKGIDGCLRCLQHGIQCHYSLQKSMGRPRKRRLVDEPSDKQTSMAVDKADAFPSPIIPSTQPGSPDKIDFYSIFEPTLSFSNDQLSPGENDFLDLLQTESPHSEPKVLHAGHDSAKSAQLSFPSDGLGLMSGVVFGDELSSSSASIIEDVGKLIQRNWQSQKFKDHFQLAELPEATPGESSESAASQVPSSWKELSLSSWDASPGPTSIIDRIPCECLSSLYLALDSLSRLPKDADGALRIARRASEVAHDVARCTKCSDIAVEDLLKTPVMQCFQNRMCLATLVPSTCNAYAAILDMIDKQAAAARENGNTVRLSFNEVGSIFPTSGADKDWTKLLHCNNHGIGPDLWRSIMRAIIRVDVCGVDIPPTDMLGDIHYRYGLRYVVKLMEEGSGERHKYMDKLAAEGRLHEVRCMGWDQPYRPLPPKERNCLRMLDAAHAALDNLNIV